MAGVCLGGLLALGYALQTAGLERTTVSSTGFITGLCVVLTPITAFLLFRDHIPAAVWVGVGLSTFGLAMLFGIEAGSTAGDVLVLGGAAAYALQIVLLERFAPDYDPVAFTLVEMLAACLGFTAIALARGDLSVPHGWTVWGALLVTGVFASAFAFLVQTWAQRELSATRTALVFAAEPVFAGLFGSSSRAIGLERSAGAVARSSSPGSSSPSRPRRLFRRSFASPPANLVAVLRPRPAAVLGMFDAAVGVTRIASALTPGLATRIDLVQGVLSTRAAGGRQVACPRLRARARLVGQARSVGGKRRAWQLAVVLVAGVAIAHLAKGLDAEEAGVSIALLVADRLLPASTSTFAGDPETKPLVLTAAAFGSLLAPHLYESHESLLPERHFQPRSTATATLPRSVEPLSLAPLCRRRKHPTTGEIVLARRARRRARPRLPLRTSLSEKTRATSSLRPAAAPFSPTPSSAAPLSSAAIRLATPTELAQLLRASRSSPAAAAGEWRFSARAVSSFPLYRAGRLPRDQGRRRGRRSSRRFLARRPADPEGAPVREPTPPGGLHARRPGGSRRLDAAILEPSFSGFRTSGAAAGPSAASRWRWTSSSANSGTLFVIARDAERRAEGSSTSSPRRRPAGYSFSAMRRSARHRTA